MTTHNLTAMFRAWLWRLARGLVTLLVLATGTHFVRVADAGNWPHWRGAQDNGASTTGSCPVKWDADSGMLWKSALPGKGCSTPVIWEKRI